MTETPDPSTEDAAYFRVIEETFIRLRGAPLLLSPSDWQTARAWRRAGIPLDLVCRVLERLFAEREERGAGRRVNSLRYCAPAVEQAWSEVVSLTAAGHRTEPQRIDVRRRLDALTRALPADLPGRDDLARRLGGLGESWERGGVERLEDELSRLDGEMMGRLEAELGEADRRALEGRVERTLAALRGRLPEQELAAAARRLRRQVVRRSVGLPVLSLFSPEAQEGDGSDSLAERPEPDPPAPDPADPQRDEPGDR